MQQMCCPGLDMFSELLLCFLPSYLCLNGNKKLTVMFLQDPWTVGILSTVAQQSH